MEAGVEQWGRGLDGGTQVSFACSLVPKGPWPSTGMQPRDLGTPALVIKDICIQQDLK